MFGISPLILVLLLGIVSLSYKAFGDSVLFNRLKFNIKAVQSGEYYRIITAGFIHVDQNHLLFNGLTLYFFGDNALLGLGAIHFIILYFVSLLMGNLFALYYHRNNPYYSAVGASGAIMGVVYSSILMFPEMKLALIFFPVPFPAYLFGIGYLIYTLFGMKSQSDGIGHTEHLGGAAGGILCTLLYDPMVFEKSFLTLILMLVVTVVAGFVFFRREN
ncbi:rhomboid family intramembrane serine protease [Flavobacteriaceae bacterium]|nr:rhomboid family intramembrane serine protease [Flavobacteriaceae bacterium]MDB9826669.1 rhomboid family intramembrane serine protease [bacterium]MDA9294307.1 rhomboid family intramembrane serine protease [Flavobacteriaceae bacterium]MDB2673148.1 rhomboid family intramembrane serine protease [Flavobacteriaceae bacterium]MDB4112986.1 rhomboid family intramembrane serine protease [Flavobacteriaceae bacterium]